MPAPPVFTMPRRLATSARIAPSPPVALNGHREWRILNFMSLHDRISIDPAIRSGKPCIRGTRIAVYDILEYLAGGMSDDQVLRDFPALTREDVRAALEFAANRERKLAASAAG
jgi:uncharacterized protein (DUF433 family)